MFYKIRKCTKCPTCSKAIIFGRSDKVFCAIKCKNVHHKTARMQMKTRVDLHNKLLRRNLVILEGIVGPKGRKVRVHKDALISHGFELTISSRSCIRNNKCRYELGGYYYFIDKNGFIEIERINNVSEYLPGFFERWEIEFPVKEVEYEECVVDGTRNLGGSTNSV